MAKERGLFGPHGSFRSDQEIKKELALKNELPPSKNPKDFSYWVDKAGRRSADINEDTSVLDTVLSIGLNPHTVLCCISDFHFGHPKANYNRIKQEVSAIKHTRNARVALLGDLVDGMWWGGTSQSEQAATLEEQYKFVNLLFNELGSKVLFACSGEHDSKWASKTGIDPYCFLSSAPYVRGVAEVKFSVGKETYNGVFSHKLRGHSIYNNTHPQMRSSRETQGADLYVSGHNHEKGVAEQAVREFGDARRVTFVALGAYKSGDEYSQRSGWGRQHPNQMFGTALKFADDEHVIETDPDIIHALRRW